jgi:GNAT superfamily N-acetyltransferase
MIVGSKIDVRPMLQQEMEMVLDWAAAEGWNPGLFDAEAFFNADPNGLFIAECDGIPVGSFSAVAYDDNYGFAGLYIVLPEYRGGRCGVELGRRTMEYLRDRTIGLDGVRAKLENYRRLGFAHAYWTIRYRGISPGNLGNVSNFCSAKMELSSLSQNHISETPAYIENLRDLRLEQVLDYDASIFPARRERFLQTWILQPGSTTLGVVQQDRLTGYGTIRPCREGYKIGPLFAEDSCIAETLLNALLAVIPGSEFYIDVPDPNTTAMEMVKHRSLTPIFETARMYRGHAPQIDITKIYGVTTLELG